MIGVTAFLRNHFKLAREVFSEGNLKTLKSKLFLDLARTTFRYPASTPNETIYKFLLKSFHKKGVDYGKRSQTRDVRWWN